MSDKPSYLGLLNAIAVGEARGYDLLSAWRERASNPDVAEVLNLVAIREQEHAAAFTKRLCELGYHVRQKSNDRFFEQLENPPADDNLLRDIVNRLDRLTSTLEELKTLRR